MAAPRRGPACSPATRAAAAEGACLRAWQAPAGARACACVHAAWMAGRGMGSALRKGVFASSVWCWGVSPDRACLHAWYTYTNGRHGGQMPAKLKFRVVHASSEDPEFPSTELNAHSPHTVPPPQPPID